MFSGSLGQAASFPWIAILPVAKALKHVSLHMGMKHYISLQGPFDKKVELLLCPRGLAEGEACRQGDLVGAPAGFVAREF
jgi:hypothetical protein